MLLLLNCCCCHTRKYIPVCPGAPVGVHTFVVHITTHIYAHAARAVRYAHEPRVSENTFDFFVATRLFGQRTERDARTQKAMRASNIHTLQAARYTINTRPTGSEHTITHTRKKSHVIPRECVCVCPWPTQRVRVPRVQCSRVYGVWQSNILAAGIAHCAQHFCYLPSGEPGTHEPGTYSVYHAMQNCAYVRHACTYIQYELAPRAAPRDKTHSCGKCVHNVYAHHIIRRSACMHALL